MGLGDTIPAVTVYASSDTGCTVSVHGEWRSSDHQRAAEKATAMELWRVFQRRKMTTETVCAMTEHARAFIRGARVSGNMDRDPFWPHLWRWDVTGGMGSNMDRYDRTGYYMDVRGVQDVRADDGTSSSGAGGAGDGWRDTWGDPVSIHGDGIPVPALSEARRLVVIESPYAGDVMGNLGYLDECIRDCALRGDSAYASHLMLTEALDDDDPAERALGIALGISWARRADMRIFYVDRGWSKGMDAARKLYMSEGLTFEGRSLDSADALYTVNTGGGE